MGTDCFLARTPCPAWAGCALLQDPGPASHLCLESCQSSWQREMRRQTMISLWKLQKFSTVFSHISLAKVRYDQICYQWNWEIWIFPRKGQQISIEVFILLFSCQASNSLSNVVQVLRVSFLCESKIHAQILPTTVTSVLIKWLAHIRGWKPDTHPSNN